VKYFICSLGEITLGIPTEDIKQIIPNTRSQINIKETENQNFFISLPALLGQKDTVILHGLVFKKDNTILLTSKIDIEQEIPDGNIHQLPEFFSGIFSFFKGACFDSINKNLILLLDTKKILECLQ